MTERRLNGRKTAGQLVYVYGISGTARFLHFFYKTDNNNGKTLVFFFCFVLFFLQGKSHIQL